MSSTSTDTMRCQLAIYSRALSSFTSSTSTLRVLHSLPTPSTPLPPPKTLYILDSSFNPPTLAHLRIATSALLHDGQPSPAPRRLLLLLATHNADKAPKPASFEHRLVMMQIFAQDLLASLSTTSTPSPQSTAPGHEPENSSVEDAIGIDIGITKHPFFASKALAIEHETGIYPPGMQQVHLTGFDTLARILDPKYYPPEHTLAPLVPFLAKHRLRVTYRTGDQWGGKEAQDEYLRGVGRGELEGIGGDRRWVSEERIVLVEGRREGEEVVSSTKVREAVTKGDKSMLKRLVTGGVAEWIMEEGLYLGG